MESPGSVSSTDGSSISSADSTSADSTIVQAVPSMSDNQSSLATDKTPAMDSDDSESDVSMSADSDDDEDEGDKDTNAVPTPAGTGPVSPIPSVTPPQMSDIPAEASKKRKFSSPNVAQVGAGSRERDHDVRKRLKPDTALERYWITGGTLQPDRSLLPAEIWHHIFTFCPPRVLGRLLQVNKSFNAHLDPSSSGPFYQALSVSATQFLPPAAIWRASRSLYSLPSMPNPLLGLSELDMWKLGCGITCQFCGRKKPANAATTDPWHPGPGETGVSPIWSFQIRSCGLCLQKETTKEIDLLLSSSVPSPLLAALPFIFLTNELHALPPSTLQNGQQPHNIQVAKHFSRSQVDMIKQKFDEVKSLGSATAEEWLKGLDGQGQEKKSDAARWERWEAQGGLKKMRNLEAIEAATRLLRTARATAPSTNGNLPSLHKSNNFPKPLHLPTNPMTSLPIPVNGIAANNVPRYGSPIQNGFPSYTTRPSQLPRHERTKEEVAELKLARKAEIEKRCMQLDPPITAAVLAHMPSFQAAIQIIQPVTDSAWEVLEPRLVSQRDDAEQREKDRIAQTRVVQEQERRLQESLIRSDSKDPADREWDDFQAPLRARIGGYADEIIRDGWNGGDKVSYDTAPRFAADVLVYVRKRFYAEVTKDEAAIRATGREPEEDPPNGPYTRRLILENMKWVFDTKIKPITEQYRKELFLCNACEHGSKYYGFEGVIQHFAAKHTNALSSGSVVVHWKSEWPEHPPFNPDPSSMTTRPYYPPVQNSSVSYSAPPPSQQHGYAYSGYQSVAVSAPMHAPQVNNYQDTQGSYYGNAQYGDQYSAPPSGPYPPPMGYQEPAPNYQTPQYPVPSHTPAPGYNDGSQGYPQVYTGQYLSTGQEMYPSPRNNSSYPVAASMAPNEQNSHTQPNNEYGATYNQAASTSYREPLPKTEEYITQLQALAKNARTLWNSIGNLKEVQGSLKVFTLIHHLLQRFQDSYQDTPPLAMLVEGLSNNKDMRPVRNVNGLLCKACSLGMIGSLSGQKKHYSFPQLVNHFNNAHAQGIPHDTLGYIPDWTKDMVDLPEINKLVSVVNAPGMDEQKLKLFTDALPELIAPPQVEDVIPQNGYDHPLEEPVGPAYAELAPSQDNHDRYYVNPGRGEPSNTQVKSEEYDPHNPGNISVSQQPIYKASRAHRQSGEGSYIEDEGRQPRIRHYEEESRRIAYQEDSEPRYVGRRPSSTYGIAPPGYERVVIREEPSMYIERPRYREAADVEFRQRRDQNVRYYETEMEPAGDHRATNGRSSHPNKDERIPGSKREPPGYGPENAIITQNSQISDVVAQISQHAQQARGQLPPRHEVIETGSEDGELRADQEARPSISHPSPKLGAATSAERFLDEFNPGEPKHFAQPTFGQEPAHHPNNGIRPAWEGESNARVQYPQETQRRLREPLEDESYGPNGRRYAGPATDEAYTIRERVPVPRQAHYYEDSYGNTAPEQPMRNRSPEIVDRRYKVNNVVYRDERQGSSNGTHRTPSRYARYESVRLENDRARSRSPVYVKMGPPTDQYRERSPGAPIHRQEPIYRTRTPLQPGEEPIYERPIPRQEVYRVYGDEPPRQRAPPQYAEPAYEYVRVEDPQGDYMIRRPVRREPAPRYYEEDGYARQPVYESRAPPSRAEHHYEDYAPPLRAEPQYEEYAPPSRAEPQYEEYDPRQPAPGSDATAGRPRYQ